MKKMNEHEKEIAKTAYERTMKKHNSSVIKKTITLSDIEKLKVDYVVDMQGKFTTCILKNGKHLSAGSAKRCTYRGKHMTKDEWNPVRGKDISLSRAVRNYVTGSVIDV